MPLSEAYLKSLHDRAAGGPPPPAADRKCRRCDYNLRGLPAGGVCPECGTPFKPAAVGRFCDNLTDAPLEYLRTLRLGLVVLGGAVGLFILAAGTSFVFGFEILAGAAFVVGVLWLVGVRLVVKPRPRNDAFAPDPLLDCPPLTSVCGLLHAAPLLAGLLIGTAVALHTGTTLSTSTQILLLAGGAAYVLAALALAPLGVYLSALSDWAGHDTLGAQFRVAIFCIIVATLMAVGAGVGAVLSPGFRAGLAGIVTMWAGIILALASVYFLFLIIRLANAAQWAVLNALHALETEARVAERKKRDAVRLTEAQRTAVPTREGHGGSWRDSGFLTIDGDDPPETREVRPTDPR